MKGSTNKANFEGLTSLSVQFHICVHQRFSFL